MSLVALAADKGSPGVSTTALALAAVWPRQVLLAECDTGGGDLVYRVPAQSGAPLDPTRGVVSLAAAARRGLRPELLAEHTQRLVGGLDVILGPERSAQSGALAGMWGALGSTMQAMPDTDVIADCGRLFHDSPVLDLIDQAALVVLVLRPTVESLAHTADRVRTLAARYDAVSRPGPAIALLVIDEPRELPHGMKEVSAAISAYQLPTHVLGGLAHDRKGAGMLRGVWGGQLSRTLLIRTAREVAATTAGRLGVPAQALSG